MLRLAAALLLTTLPAHAAEEPPYVGTWDCEVSTFTFTADSYDSGEGPMPILKSEKNGGAYTLVGVIKGDLVWPDSEVHRRELTIRASRNAQPDDFRHVMDSIRGGLVPTDRLATHATTLERVPADMPVWAHDRSGLIQAIVSV